MKPPKAKTLGLLALASFLAALGLGWGLAQRTPRAESFAGETTPRKDVPEAQLGKSSPARLAEMERELILACHPKQEVHSGERLLELLLESDSTGPSRNAINYARRWARADPSGMFHWFQKQGTLRLPYHPEYSSDWMAESLFHSWAKSDPEAALQAAASIPSSEKRDALEWVLSELSRTNPDRAVEFIAKYEGSLLPGSFRPSNAEDFLRKWAVLKNIPQGPHRRALQSDFFRNAVRYSRATADAIWAEASPELREQLVALGRPLYGVFNLETESESPPGNYSSDSLRGQIRAHIEAKGDAGLAENYVAEYGADWMLQDPAAALAWADSHLSGRAKFERLGGLYWEYAERDFASARRAWEALPPGRVKEQVLSNMVNIRDREEEIRQMLKQLPTKSAAKYEARLNQAR